MNCKQGTGGANNECAGAGGGTISVENIVTPAKTPLRGAKDAEDYARRVLGIEADFKGVELEICQRILDMVEFRLSNEERRKLVYIGPQNKARKVLGLKRRSGSNDVFEVIAVGDRVAFGIGNHGKTMQDLQVAMSIMEEQNWMLNLSIDGLLDHERAHIYDVMHAGKFYGTSIDFHEALLERMEVETPSMHYYLRPLAAVSGEYIHRDSAETFAEAYRLYRNGLLPPQFAWVKDWFDKLGISDTDKEKLSAI